MKLVYAPSYLGIVFLLQSIELKKAGVITRNVNIKQLCEHIGVLCYYLADEKPTSFRELLSYKKKLIQFAKQIVGHEIIFCFYTYAVSDLFLIGVLSKNNDVSFFNQDLIYQRAHLASNFCRRAQFRRIFLDQLIYGLVYRIKFDVFVEYDLYLIGIAPKRLIAEYGTFNMIGNLDRIAEDNYQLVRNAYYVNSYDIIYIDNLANFPGDAIKVARILEFLVERGYSVAIKPHPGQDLAKVFDQFDKIDKEIPAEVLGSFAIKCIIGVFSTALHTLALSTKVISLINLVSLGSPQMKEDLSGHFLLKGSIIPKDNEDLLAQLL